MRDAPFSTRGAHADVPSLGRRLTKSETQEIVVATDAYERAANDARQAVLAEGNSELTEARMMLRVAAAESFRLARVLPLDAERSAAWTLVRIASLGVIGEVGIDYRAWADHADRLLADGLSLHTPASVLEQMPWDEVLRELLPRIWLALLRQPLADATEAPFEALGRLREMRADAEARQMSELAAADAAHLQLTLAGLYGVAEAAATLVSHIRRATHARVDDRLTDAFVAARGVVPAASALGRALPWLHFAALLIARRQSAQIALPGLLT